MRRLLRELTKYLKSARDEGYKINLTFLWLSSAQEAVKRVGQRVRQGGHSLPEDVIIRRYSLGIRNLLKYYLPLADTVLILDNSTEEPSQRIIASKEKDGSLKILNIENWKRINEVGYER